MSLLNPGIYSLRNGLHSFCKLAVSSPNSDDPYPLINESETQSSSLEEEWELTPGQNGEYYIRNQSTSQFLSIDESANKLTLGQDYYPWNIEQNNRGHYTLISNSNGSYLNVDSNSNNRALNLVQNSESQAVEWDILPCSH